MTDLESQTFDLRQKAEKALIDLGESAEAALRNKLASNRSLEVRRRVEQILEKRGADLLRQLRAVEVLEQIGAPEAQQTLRTLARSAVNPRVRQASDAAMRRLGTP